VITFAREKQARELTAKAEAKLATQADELKLMQTQVNKTRKEIGALTTMSDKMKANMAELNAKICQLDQANAQAAYEGMQATETLEALRIAHTEERRNMEEKLRSESALVSQLQSEIAQFWIEKTSAKAVQKANDEIQQDADLEKEVVVAVQKAYDEIRGELEQAKQANNTDAHRARIQEGSIKIEEQEDSIKTEDVEHQEKAVVASHCLKKSTSHREGFPELAFSPSLGRVGDSSAGDIVINSGVVVMNQNNKEEKVSNRSLKSFGPRKSFGSRMMGGWFRKFVGMGGGYVTDDGSQYLNSYENRSQSTFEMSVQSCKRDNTEIGVSGGTQESLSEEVFDDDASYTDASDSDADGSYDSNGFSSSYSSSFDSRAETKDLEPSDSIVSESTAKEASNISNTSTRSKSISSTFESDIEGSGKGKDSNEVIRWFNTSDWSKSLILNLQQEGRDELEEKGSVSERVDDRILTLAE
jgi:hypothetical protein